MSNRLATPYLGPFTAEKAASFVRDVLGEQTERKPASIGIFGGELRAATPPPGGAASFPLHSAASMCHWPFSAGQGLQPRYPSAASFARYMGSATPLPDLKLDHSARLFCDRPPPLPLFLLLSLRPSLPPHSAASCRYHSHSTSIHPLQHSGDLALTKRKKPTPPPSPPQQTTTKSTFAAQRSLLWGDRGRSVRELSPPILNQGLALCGSPLSPSAPLPIPMPCPCPSPHITRGGRRARKRAAAHPAPDCRTGGAGR